MNLEIFKDFAIETAKSSGEILMTYFNSKYAIKKKSSVDLVTKADIESENNIIDSISMLIDRKLDLFSSTVNNK